MLLYEKKRKSVLKNQNNFVLKGTLDSQNYKIIPVTILGSFKTYLLFDEVVNNKYFESYKHNCILKLC